MGQRFYWEGNTLEGALELHTTLCTFGPISLIIYRQWVNNVKQSIKFAILPFL